MKITLLSPYHSGSHQAWVEGYRAHSNHDISLLTLPGRFWKWRMHGGAVTLARHFLMAGEQPDLLLATDMLDLTTFIALTRCSAPIVLYMHENQLTYPLPADRSTGPMRRQRGERDQHYVFINFASMLAADHVLFNSDYHRRVFLAALPKFLRHFPEYRELETVATIASKSSVLPVGVDLARLKGGQTATTGQAPLILWNQRWEYDKNPADFFRALYAMQEADIPFRLALCGENFRRRPVEFDEGLERLADQVVHVGFADWDRYRQLLWEATVTVSTAHHEFFGISIMEAIACHTFPILPRRLSYPELLPERYHRHCLYPNQGELIQRLRWALTQPAAAAEIARQLAADVAVYDWARLAPHYDGLLADLSTRQPVDRLRG